MGYHIGIDVGGTFTDVCVAGPSGEISVYKTPTTPDIATGVLDALRLAAQAAGMGLSEFLASLDRFGHGSTVAVNALLQRRGVRTGLITTRGFGDTLWIARMMAMTTGLSPEQWTHYRLRQRPDPLIDRRLVREVDERVDYRGQVLVPLREEVARRAIRALLAQDIQALAICTLWSFQNPVHERMLRDIAHQLAPDLYVCISSDLVPVIKEYERMATTVVNAYLGPVVRDYIRDMDAQLKASGFRSAFFMLNSVGGVIPPEEAGVKPVQLLGSGPSGGVLAASFLAAQLGHSHVVTADMGGTSFDVGLIVDGEPVLDNEVVVGNLNLLNPMISVRSIGCGGGSIASVRDGMLKVGPRSAGSHPGPACYGRGGDMPTVTDADLVLGFLNPDYFLGGAMPLDSNAAWSAIQQYVAGPLGMSVLEAAAGIREVAQQRMADLLRQSTLERGYDPRDFRLYAYGGAGPLHACAFGQQSGICSIVVPLAAPVFSAQGILSADMRLSRQRSVLQRTGADSRDRAAGIDGPALEAVFQELTSELREAFEKYGVSSEGHQYFLRSVSMRYARQVHELRVPVEYSLAEPDAASRLLAAFDRVYEHRYGRGTGSRSAVIEITSCHLQLVHVLSKASLARPRSGSRLEPFGARRVYLDGWVEVPVYRWEQLPSGASFSGPALVEAPGTTVWVAPSAQAAVDNLGNLLLEIRT